MRKMQFLKNNLTFLHRIVCMYIIIIINFIEEKLKKF